MVTRTYGDQHWELLGSAVLFDMDGTLVDSTSVVESLWREFARREGVDPEAVLSFAHGRRSRDTIARFVQEGAVEDATAVMLREELDRGDGITAVPGALDFLGALAEHVPVAIVTSASRSLAQARLGWAGFAIVDVLVCAEDVDDGKPAPDGYLLAAQQLGTRITTALAFEDAESGVKAAVDARANTVVVGSWNSPLTQGLPRLRTYEEAEVFGGNGSVIVCGPK